MVEVEDNTEPVVEHTVAVVERTAVVAGRTAVAAVRSALAAVDTAGAVGHIAEAPAVDTAASTDYSHTLQEPDIVGAIETPSPTGWQCRRRSKGTRSLSSLSRTLKGKQ